MVYDEYVRFIKRRTFEINEGFNTGCIDETEPNFQYISERFISDELSKEQKINDYINQLVLSPASKISNMPVDIDLTQDEKLLLINHKKEKPYFEKGLPTFKCLNFIPSGGFFGEVALVFKTPRTASIIASEDCHFLYLEERDYFDIFGAHVDNVRVKVDFITKLFPVLSTQRVSKFCYMLEERIYQRGNILYSQGDDPKELYIIKKGEI